MSLKYPGSSGGKEKQHGEKYSENGLVQPRTYNVVQLLTREKAQYLTCGISVMPHWILGIAERRMGGDGHGVALRNCSGDAQGMRHLKLTAQRHSFARIK